MSISQIKAGAAFVEVMAKDKTGAGLARAQTRLTAFAASVKALNSTMVSALKKVEGLFNKIGASLVAAGGSITAIMAKAVSTFIDVSEHAKKMGKAIAGLDPAKAERLSNAWENLKAVGGVVLFRLGEALAAPLTRLFEMLAAVGMQIANFIKNNQQLVVVIAAVGAGMLIAGAAFLVFGKMLAIVAAGLTVAGFLIPALLTPMGACIALVVALTAALLIAAGAFLMFNESARDSVSGIVAALATGDILAAWGIITKGMETAWLAAIGAMKDAYASLVAYVTEQGAKITSALHAAVSAIAAATKVKAQQNPSFITGGTSIAAQLAQPVTGAIAGVARSKADSAQASADKTRAESADALAKSMDELAALNKSARDNAAAQFSSAGVNLNLSSLMEGLSGGRQKFGVTGTFSSSAAGQNRTLGGIEKEQKKSNEYLERVAKLLGEIKANGGVEFAH